MKTRPGKIFKPANSRGGIYTLLFLVSTVSIITIPFILLYVETLEITFIIWLATFGGMMALLFGITLHGYYSMEYIMNDDGLTLKWSFLEKRIPYESLKGYGIGKERIKGGIRTAGVGIPGHLYGKFKLVVDGNLCSFSLYVSNLSKFVFLLENNGRYVGLTPSDPDVFIKELKSRNPDILELQPVERPPEDYKTPEAMQFRRKTMLMLGISISLLVAIIVEFIFFYFALPNTVPTHFGITFQPDSWGSKNELWIAILIITALPLFITLLIFQIANKNKPISHSKHGYQVMLLPVLINVIFLALATMLFVLTLIHS
ncbi:MAG: PH domain-containing protein [Candidatus Hodarchaeota archaeon]